MRTRPLEADHSVCLLVGSGEYFYFRTGGLKGDTGWFGKRRCGSDCRWREAKQFFVMKCAQLYNKGVTLVKCFFVSVNVTEEVFPCEVRVGVDAIT